MVWAPGEVGGGGTRGLPLNPRGVAGGWAAPPRPAGSRVGRLAVSSGLGASLGCGPRMLRGRVWGPVACGAPEGSHHAAVWRLAMTGTSPPTLIPWTGQTTRGRIPRPPLCLLPDPTRTGAALLASPAPLPPSTPPPSEGSGPEGHAHSWVGGLCPRAAFPHEVPGVNPTGVSYSFLWGKWVTEVSGAAAAAGRSFPTALQGLASPPQT